MLPEMDAGTQNVSGQLAFVQDFAFESSEKRMQQAAHLMASSLAGAYAMNQCREPMRGSLLTHLHALLKPNLDPGVSRQSSCLSVLFAV